MRVYAFYGAKSQLDLLTWHIGYKAHWLPFNSHRDVKVQACGASAIDRDLRPSSRVSSRLPLFGVAQGYLRWLCVMTRERREK